MAEALTLTTPETKPSNTAYAVRRLELNWGDAVVDIFLTGVNGESRSFQYTGVTATNLMIALNKANLSTRSLNQRVFDRLIADGLLVGTVTGSVP